MPDSQCCPTRSRGGQQVVGLRERPRHRLFDQDPDSPLQKRQGHIPVPLGRHRDGDGIDPVEDLPEVGQRTRPGARRDLRRAARERIDDRDELRSLGRRQDAGMMPAQVADADYGDSQRVTGHAVPSLHESSRRSAGGR